MMAIAWVSLAISYLVYQHPMSWHAAMVVCILLAIMHLAPVNRSKD